MNNRRRHAHDFTNSLTSFRQTMTEEESNQIMFPASLENRLDDIINKQDDDKHNPSENNKSRDSVILAGSLTSQPSFSNSCNIAKENYNTYNIRQLLSRDTWIESDETSYLSIKPDLNKCINLFHNEHLTKDDGLEEQLNTTLSEIMLKGNNICHLSRNITTGQQNFNKRPRSLSVDSLKNTVSLNQKLTRSKSYTTLERILKRDTNYNIKIDQLLPSRKVATKVCHSKDVETIVPSFNALLLSKPFALSSRKDSYSMEDDQRYDSSSEKSSKEELNPFELRTFLHSLADQNSLKETVKQQRLLKRLSVSCYDSPKVFTEGLLTIIEESVINNDSLQYPEVSLHKFNEEVRKMCKFIEDETVPEWPQSPGMSRSICTKRKSQEAKSNLSSLAFGTSNKNLHFTPVSPRRNIKSPKKIYRRMSRNSYMKNLHDSTSTFENLEAYCENLYPDEYKTLSTREMSQLQSPLRNLDNIRRACENQMASLEDSFDIHKEIKKAGTCKSNSTSRRNKIPETQNLQYRQVSCDRTDSKKNFDTFKQQTDHSNHHEMINEFENTLMYEIAKKRQRCLDTAKIMMEIDLESMGVTEETYSNTENESEPSPTINDDKFMKILMCVKKYQDYLEENKPLLALLHRAKLNNSPYTSYDRKNVRTRKMSDKTFGTCASLGLLDNKPTLKTPELSPRKKSISPSSAKHRSTKTILSKPRLFVTPGKTPVNKSCRPKRTYFPNLLPGLNKQNEPNSHAKKIYRQMGNYDHVISPVGMYIKGTNLKKNVRPKTDEMQLIPKKKPNTRSPSPRMKFRLSPKPPKGKVIETTIEDKKVVDNFLKVPDKLLTDVHMIKKAKAIGNP